MMRQTTSGERARNLWQRAWRFVRGLPLRMYALAMIVLVSWVSYRAIRYLLVSLLVPSAAPQQITGLPVRLTEDVLRSERGQWEGIAATVHPRSPLAHYHRMDSWIQPDPGNNCTTSGCHTPLPHARRKEVDAFLNMHATSMHCGVCHFDVRDVPLTLTWYRTREGSRCGVPAALRALTEVIAVRGKAQAANEDDRRRIAGLLDEAARDADGQPQLRVLADHFAAATAPGEPFDRLLAAAETQLPRQFRGEYGCKLAVVDARGEPMLAHPGTEEAVRAFSAHAPPPGAERDELVKRLHPLRRESPRACHECHVGEGGLVDFHVMGYPAERARQLVGPVVVRMIEQMRDGRPFYLPEFVRGSASHDEPDREGGDRER